MSNLTTLPRFNKDARKRLIPVGGIIVWWGTTAPDGFLLCNGTSYSAVDYPRLAEQQNIFSGSFTVPNIAAPVAGTAYIIKY